VKGLAATMGNVVLAVGAIGAGIYICYYLSRRQHRQEARDDGLIYGRQSQAGCQRGAREESEDVLVDFSDYTVSRAYQYNLNEVANQ
jgi:hypothetical protein